MQEVSLGETIVRRYSPASLDQSQIVVNIYSSEKPRVALVGEPGVTKCGRLCLHLDDDGGSGVSGGDPGAPAVRGGPAAAGGGGPGGSGAERRRREVETTMTFGDTEIRVGALEVATGNCVRACIEFLCSV